MTTRISRGWVATRFEPEWKKELPQFTCGGFMGFPVEYPPKTGIVVGAMKRSVVIENDLKHERRTFLTLLSRNKILLEMSWEEAKSEDEIGEAIIEWLDGRCDIRKVSASGTT